MGDMTKKYRAVAGEDKVLKIDPFAEMTGITGSELPYCFETDDLDEMRAYVDSNGLTMPTDDM